jgi:PAS domain S-box-containing protein
MMYSAPGGRSSRRAATLLALALLFLLALLSTGASSMTVMLRVAFQPDLPPYQFVDAYGRAAGAHIDILNSIARRYNMQLEYVPMNSNTACLEALKSEQVDAVLGIHNGVRHDDSVRLTTVISQSQVCIVAPSVRAREIRENLGSGYYHTAFENGLVEYMSLRKQIDLRTRELREANRRLEQQIIEIRNANELRNQIVEDNPNGIIVFNTDFVITACNHNACEIIGAKTPPIGQSIFEVELLRSLIEAKKEQWFSPDAELNMDDLTTRDKNGETVIYRCDIRRLYHSEGGIRGIILSIKNVTRERKNRELFYERERNRALNVAGQDKIPTSGQTFSPLSDKIVPTLGQ